MKRVLALLFTLPTVFLAAGDAAAQQLTLCQTDTVPSQITTWSQSVTLDKFDPDLGILQSVALTLTGTITGQAGFESLENEPVTLTTDFSALIQVSQPGGFFPVVSVSPLRQFITPVAAFDGTDDFAGPSGETFTGISETESQTSVSPWPTFDLALFTGLPGAGPAGTITLPVRATGTSTGTGAGNLALMFYQEATAVVEVCYTYSLDCNSNGIPDEEDLLSGSSSDSNNNSVPDECEGPQQVTICSSESTPSQLTNWTEIVTLDKFDPDLGILLSVAVTLTSTISGEVRLESSDPTPSVVMTDFSAHLQLFRPDGSLITSVSPSEQFSTPFSASDGVIDFGGTSGTTIAGIMASSSQTSVSPPPLSDLALFAGTPGAGPAGTISLTVQAQGTSSASGAGNLTFGVTPQASAQVEVCYIYAFDCNQNGIPDDDEFTNGLPDCNGNGTLDECELVGNDCNVNMIPDECEPDCNNNNVPDDCDLANGLPDCNDNGTLDECEKFTDCNSNLIPDECELVGNDCNANLIPDECEPDCDDNHVPDECDLTGGEPDCNGNGMLDVCDPFDDCNSNLIPDECELVMNDCNNNAIPDGCEPDCNNNNVPDECDLVNGQPDCNDNGTLDECEEFDDCNANLVPDECELIGNDCNLNMLPDECDIANGTPDLNQDGIPDECGAVVKTVCQTDSIPTTLANWIDSVTFDRFDPDLGLLHEVNVALTGTFSIETSFESLDNAPSIFTVDLSSQMAVMRPGLGSTITSLSSNQTLVENMSAFDGTIDFGGTSGQSFMDNNVLSSTHSSPAPLDDLGLFTGIPGAGPPGTITLPVTLTALASASGPVNFTLQTLQSASAEVEVCYVYRLDCNRNGIPDQVELLNGLNDVNGDGLLDDCGAGISLCNGDGGNQFGCTDCPCANNAPAGTVGGCLNSAGTSAMIGATGDTSASLPPGSTTDLRFTLSGAPPGALCVLASGDAIAPQNLGNLCFGLTSGSQSSDRDGLRCTVMNLKRHGSRSANLTGDVMDSSGPSRVWGGEAQPNSGLSQQGGFAAGQTRYFQVTYREDALVGCMRGLNTSQAIEALFMP